MLAALVCDSCGGHMAPWLTFPIDAKKNEPTPFSAVARCQDCGLGALSPLPDAGSIPGLYALDDYYTHGETHMPERASSFAEKVLTKLAWLADRSRPFEPEQIARRLPTTARICDLGCGHAEYLRRFKELGFDVIGVDPDAAARKQAAAFGVTVLDGTAEDLPSQLQPGTYDLVIMTHALEHCRSPKQAIKNAYTLVKDGGYCYVEVPNCACEHFQTFTVCSEMFDAPRHIYFFTPKSLTGLVERTGFSVEEHLFSGYVRDFAPSWREWEVEIAEMIQKAQPEAKPKRHTFAASVALFLRSFWRRPETKYDSVGLIMIKADCMAKGSIGVRR